MVLLRKLRQEKGLSIVELAKQAKVDRFFISNVECKMIRRCGNINIKLIKLAKFFKIENPLDLLVYETEVLREKKCLNQRCLLNKECYCQSDNVIAGEFCQNENAVSKQAKKVLVNKIQNLFLEY